MIQYLISTTCKFTNLLCALPLNILNYPTYRGEKTALKSRIHSTRLSRGIRTNYNTPQRTCLLMWSCSFALSRDPRLSIFWALARLGLLPSTLGAFLGEYRWIPMYFWGPPGASVLSPASGSHVKRPCAVLWYCEILSLKYWVFLYENNFFLFCYEDVWVGKIPIPQSRNRSKYSLAILDGEPQISVPKFPIEQSFLGTGIRYSHRNLVNIKKEY